MQRGQSECFPKGSGPEARTAGTTVVGGDSGDPGVFMTRDVSDRTDSDFARRTTEDKRPAEHSG